MPNQLRSKPLKLLLLLVVVLGLAGGLTVILIGRGGEKTTAPPPREQSEPTREQIEQQIRESQVNGPPDFTPARTGQ